MNASDVIGYAANADTYCVECIGPHLRDSTGRHIDPDTPSSADSEGNPIGAVFAAGDNLDLFCARCGWALEEVGPVI